MNEKLNKFTAGFTRWVGRPWATVLAIALVVIWIAGLPIIGLSDTYQLIINTTTTIITFIMVFAIQNTQNRDSAALHIKIDRLLEVSKAKTDDLMDLEDRSDKELEIKQRKMQRKARKK